MVKNAGMLLTLMIGSFLGVVKGPEAKQKWTFRMKSRNHEREEQKRYKKLAKDGGVILDEIEIAAYHRI